jgi:transposase-like protein
MTTQTNELAKVLTMVKADKRNSKEKGRKIVFYREATKKAVIDFTSSTDMNYREVADHLGVALQSIYTWRYKAQATSPKPTKVKQESSLVQRIHGQIEDHQNEIARLNKQIKVLKMAQEVGLDFILD